MPDYPQINIKLLSQEDRELAERAKLRALELRLTFKDFVLDCIKQVLALHEASAENATREDINVLNVRIAALEEKVSHQRVGKGELFTLQERLNQLRVGVWNEIKKDREQVAEMKLAIARLESHIEQLMPSLNIQVEGEGLSFSDSDWLFGEGEVGAEDVDGF